MRYRDALFYDPDLDGLDAITTSITQLIAQSDYLDTDQQQQLIDCCFFAATAHKTQTRHSGEPYICHPIKVAEILASEVQFDIAVLQAAILHDVIEDTPISKKTLIQHFSEEVAALVDGVSKLEKNESISPQVLQAQTFEKLVSAMEADPRVVMIKFADRLHNMQTLDALPSKKRARIAQETLDVYVPIATRLGMYVFKTEMEELAFKHVNPWRYNTICKLLTDNETRENTANQVIQTLQQQFKLANLAASVRKRRRNLLNIYKKLQKSRFTRRPLENASIPFIILTENIDDCYRVLGIIHQIYPPVFKKLTDYIASPKANGYQSIHTSALTKDRRVINFQIRTKAMHAIAESGIIAIWRQHNQEKITAKQPNSNQPPRDKSIRRWLVNLKDLRNYTSGSLDYYEAIKRDLTGYDIQVFTPKGEPIALPVGATVIDFAYHIHTDLGNHLSAAKVNGIDVDLTFTLNNGQTVEVLTQAAAHPDCRWLQVVKTARARVAIRHYFNSLPESDLEKLGHSELERYLAKRGFTYANLKALLKLVAKKRGIKRKALLRKIALDEVGKKQTLNDLQHLLDQDGLTTTITAQVFNQPGALASVADVFGQCAANIVSVELPNDMQRAEVSMTFIIKVQSLVQLEHIMFQLSALPLVKKLTHKSQPSLHESTDLTAN